MYPNRYHPQVVANTTKSVVKFYILSPDASLSYDRVKLRLEEYRRLLITDSDTIELSTESGKVVFCRKEITQMAEYLNQADVLLRNIAQSRQISTIVVLHHLRELSEVLDNLKLYDECLLTGNCALDLAAALGRRSLEFRNEQAETFGLIAGLSAYQPRARTLFTAAISISERVVEYDASHSNKKRLFNLLDRAGYWAEDNPRLGAQWLKRAVQLMNELPPSMVTGAFRTITYYNYGRHLSVLEHYAQAAKAFRESVSICHALASINPVQYAGDLVTALERMGIALHQLGEYEKAASAYKEALGEWMPRLVQDPVQYNVQLAHLLCNYGVALQRLGDISASVEPLKEAVSLFSRLTRRGPGYRASICYALYRYGWSCHLHGHHAEALAAYRGCNPLLHAIVATDPGKKECLSMALHTLANSLHALGKDGDADKEATKALQMNQGRVLQSCKYAPDFNLCFVCQRVNIPNPSIPHTPPPAVLVPFTSSPVETGEYHETSASPTPTEGSTATAITLEIAQPGVLPDCKDPVLNGLYSLFTCYFSILLICTVCCTVCLCLGSVSRH